MNILILLVGYLLIPTLSNPPISGEFIACKYYSSKIFGEYISFQFDNKFVYCRYITEGGTVAQFCSFGRFEDKENVVELLSEGRAVIDENTIEVTLGKDTKQNRKDFNQHFWKDRNWDSANFREFSFDEMSRFSRGNGGLSHKFLLVEDSIGLKLYPMRLDTELVYDIKEPRFCKKLK